MAKTAKKCAYQIYAELCEYKPTMWRRLLVPADIKMSRLSYVLMTLFEMQGIQPFCVAVPREFNARRRVEPDWVPEAGYTFKMWSYELLDEDEFPTEIDAKAILTEFDDEELEEQRNFDATKYALNSEMTTPGDHFLFEYDYVANDWALFVKLEEAVEVSGVSEKQLPRVLGGEGGGIIEGYCDSVEELMNAARTLKEGEGEEYEVLCRRLGYRAHDLEAFDIDDMNFRLLKVPAIYEKAIETEQPLSSQDIKILTRQYQNKTAKTTKSTRTTKKKKA